MATNNSAVRAEPSSNTTSAETTDRGGTAAAHRWWGIARLVPIADMDGQDAA